MISPPQTLALLTALVSCTAMVLGATMPQKNTSSWVLLAASALERRFLRVNERAEGKGIDKWMPKARLSLLRKSWTASPCFRFNVGMKTTTPFFLIKKYVPSPFNYSQPCSCQQTNGSLVSFVRLPLPGSGCVLFICPLCLCIIAACAVWSDAVFQPSRSASSPAASSASWSWEETLTFCDVSAEMHISRSYSNDSWASSYKKLFLCWR